MKKLLFAFLSLFMIFTLLSNSIESAYATDGYFTDGYHGHTNGSEILYMKGDEFSIYYINPDTSSPYTFYRINENNEIIQLSDSYYSSQNDTTHPKDEFKLYVFNSSADTPDPQNDPFVTIRFVNDLSLLPDDYYTVSFSTTSIDPNKPVVPGYTKGDIIKVKIFSTYINTTNTPWTVTSYPEFLKPISNTEYEAINYGDGNVVVNIGGKTISEEISVAEIIYKCGIRFLYNEDEYGNYRSMSVLDSTYPTSSNTFGIGKQYKLSISLYPTINGVGTGDEVSDPENIDWTVDNDNVTLDNINKTITFNKVGQTILTAKYKDFVVSTHLFIREDGVYVEAIEPNATVQPDTQYEPQFSLTPILNEDETNYYEVRYILTPDMQEKYGVKYLHSIPGITINNQGKMYFSKDLAGETITYQYVVIDVENNFYKDSWAHKISEEEKKAEYDFESGKISRNQYNKVRFGLKYEICDYPFDSNNQIEMTVSQNGKTFKTKAINSQITVAKDSNDITVPENIESVLENLTTGSNDEIIAQKEVLTETYQLAINDQELDLSYEALLNLDKCLQIAYPEKIKTNVSGVVSAEGLITSTSNISFNKVNNFQFIAKTQTDEKEVENINNYILENNQTALAIFDFSLTHQIDEEKSIEITETKNPIRITLAMPDGVSNPENLVIIRNHNGEMTEIPVTISDNYIIFETDRFSTYALVEKKPSSSTDNNNQPEISVDETNKDSQSTSTDKVTQETTNTPTAPATADTVSILPYVLISGLSLFSIIILRIRKYSNY